MSSCNCNTPEAPDVKPVHYKDDFDFFMRLFDCEGNDIGYPDFDWTASFFTTSPYNAFVASSIGGKTTNCFNDGGRIHIIANRHGMPPGEIHVEFKAMLTNDYFPDGARDIYKPLPVGIELVRRPTPCPTALEVELMIPFIRGKAFTYEDFTEEQLDDMAQRAAGHVTIEDLGIATLEDIDKEMSMYVNNAVISQLGKPYEFKPVLHRGYIPCNARPGIVYIDHGRIKLHNPANRQTWDLTPFAKLLRGNENVEIFYIPCGGHKADEIKKVFENAGIEESDSYTILDDGISYKLIFTRPPEFYTGMCALLIYTKATNLKYGYIYIGDDGTARIVDPIKSGMWLKYPEIEFSDEALCEIATALVQHNRLPSGIRPVFHRENVLPRGISRYIDIRRWRATRITDQDKYTKRYFARVTKFYQPKARVTGLFNIRVKSNKGNVSRWRKIYVTRKGFVELI